MDLPGITFWTAFLAGIATFFAPCIIPVLPGFFAFLGGRSVGGSQWRVPTRWFLFGETLVFVLGFTIVFVLLGVGVHFLGQPLTAHREMFEKIGGVLLILFGISLTGILPIHPIFGSYKLLRSLHSSSRILQNLSFGAIFGFAWTPCIGPLLGSILFLATGEESARAGGTLLFFFSLGLAVPFLICSLFVPELTKVLKKISLLARYSRFIFSGILIFLGILLFVGKLGQYSVWFIERLGTGLVF